MTEIKEKQRTADVCIVGGAGHVGLPLALALANKGQRVIAYDINKKSLETIGQGKMPFIEYGAEPILRDVLNKTLFLSSEISDIATCKYVVITVGTPVDEYLNPKLRNLLEFITNLQAHLDTEQTIIIRSTVYPRTCRQLKQVLDKKGGEWHIAYCPERIAQGYAIEELGKLPQIVSGLSEQAVADSTKLFSLIAPSVIRLDIEEAELAKLFSNAWRYIQFATANQFT